MPKPIPTPKKTKFYFAFPDRAYHYECASCDALCCRGHGIGTAAQETPALLSRYPDLAWAATKIGREGSDFINPAGGCFFLTEKNLCQVEQDHGRDAKPGVCVLFPFNDFSRLGDVVVVRPHFLCPLRLLPGKGVGRHADLERALRETGVVSRALGQPGPDLPPSEAHDVIRREEAFRDRCGAAIGARSFHELLLGEAEDEAALLRWRKRAMRLWGISGAAGPRDYLDPSPRDYLDPSPRDYLDPLPRDYLDPLPRDYLDDLLLALAPPLRVRMLFLSERRRLRILGLAEAYLRTVARISSRPLGLQGAHQLIVHVLPVLRLFSYGNASLRFPSPEATQGVAFQNPELTLAFFQVLEELQGGRKLFDALEGALPKRISEIERGIFYHQLAQRVRELRRSRPEP